MKLYTKISSGKFKGKRLELPSLSTTRSTKSIVKESFFNVIRDEIYSLTFIEGFGGSGVMASEAVSNGAREAIAIEKDRAAFKITQSNLASLQSPNLKAINGDSFSLLHDLVNSQNGKVLLYLDPPFDIRAGFDDIYEKLVNLISQLKKEKIYMIVFEHNSDFKFGDEISAFKLVKFKKFGATSLSYFQ